ncbi:hypothetical protein [Croceitalea rosinachiae]|uniref:Uncharacterized protein n=1 Tax=Croceitalea rosinachiae TaxID=3075596 RepID=A0ABU3AD71_9FLAO|nr:hypothetical protein [Croceitalea sp. F388]MDT0606856.1 hypothetical protein [Croceitalea sp. F388]
MKSRATYKMPMFLGWYSINSSGYQKGMRHPLSSNDHSGKVIKYSNNK